MRRVACLLLLWLPYLAVAAPEFPALTGRVVDGADMLSASAEQRIAEASAAHEQATTNQVVVATVPDLQGYSIEEYGYQLGRHWGIGQKDKNNGVVLLIAQAERKVRIEVGYGLEGELTDAIASNIINTVITPAFKGARFDAGAEQGTAAIIAALGGKYAMQTPRRAKRDDTTSEWKIAAFIILFLILRGVLGGRGFLAAILAGSAVRSGFGGGGFGGGGGGFGGGGASGGW